MNSFTNDEYAYNNKLANTVADGQDPLSQYSADAFTAVNTQGNGTDTMSVHQQRENIMRGVSSINKFNSPLLA